MLEVVDPGLLMVLQDGGRPGHEDLGIPPSGACDGWGLAVANLLADAPLDGVAIEVTLGGAELLVVETCAVSLAGADLGAERDDGRPLRPDATHRLPAGSRFRFLGSARGARAYVGLAGGIVAARVLGSAATHVQGGLGGLDGRALRAGDRLVPVRRGDLAAAGRGWPTRIAPHPAAAARPIRFVPGPDLASLPDGTPDALAATAWRVAGACDRMGIRLNGSPLPAGAEIVSQPVVPGAIQVPADGQPLVIMVDGPTVGGYPVVGVVPRAELPRLGQLRPGDEVRFAPQEAEEARGARREQRRLLAVATDALHADAVWHRLAEHAGG
ncbi:MAG: biotin-dependent carboxyltransferase family protein [Chloroflexota bacterium]